MLFFFAFLIFLNYLDYATTGAIIALGGAEANPILAYLHSLWGMPSIGLFKLASLALWVFVIYKTYKSEHHRAVSAVLFCLCALYSVVVVRSFLFLNGVYNV